VRASEYQRVQEQLAGAITALNRKRAEQLVR
jgi:hypothetical protein